MAERTMQPVDPRRQPKTSEAVARGGDRPPEAPGGARPPVREPYGRGSRAGSRLARGEDVPRTGPGAADDPAPSPILPGIEGVPRTTDHATIRAWAERHGGRPAALEAPAARSGIAIIRIAFPDDPAAPGERLGEIGWEAFFQEFERAQLALAHDPESRFHRLVGRGS
jgi:hypothetical protein